MNSLECRIVVLVDEVNHCEVVVISNYEDVGSTAWSDLHVFAQTINLDSFDDLM